MTKEPYRKELLLPFIALIFILLAACNQQDKQFSIVLLPDTQQYSKKRPAIYENQAKWIVENQKRRNIKFTIHLGDIVFHMDSISQWRAASMAHEILDSASIPYSIMPGNHDMDMIPGINEMDSFQAFKLKPATFFNQFFGIDRYQDKALWYGGHYGEDNNNNYWFFAAGKLKFMVVALEYNPRPEAVIWANNLIQEHKNYLVIIATHCYQTAEGEYANCALDLGVPGLSHKIKLSAEDIFNKLVSLNKNVFMVLSGHAGCCSFRLASRGETNLPLVIEIMTDYSGEDPFGLEGIGNLGNGWLRILTFDLEKNLIHVEPLSVEEGNPEIFENGKPEFYESGYPHDPDDPYHQFSIPFNSKDYLQMEKI